MTDAEEKKEIVLNGISASPGICIGKAYLVDQEGVEVIKRYIVDKKDLESEKNRFKAAVKLAKDELHEIIEGTSEELRQHADILETHVLLLRDKMLYGRTIEFIEKKRVNAEWALKLAVSHVKSMFQDITDPYLKERSSDIVHVSDRIMRHLIGAESVKIAGIDKRVILVAMDLSPAETSQINLEKIMGFVTVRGGVTSHTSIVARSMGIPAVQGLVDALKTIRTDDIIVVDGTSGVVVVHPTERTLVEYSERQVNFETYRASIARKSHLKAETTDGRHIRVMGNIEQPEQVVTVMDNGGEGIGLYRTEFEYLVRRQFPSEEVLFDCYRDVVEVMAGKPVTIRTLDINGDKVLLRNSGTAEANPALGLRAIRYCIKRPDVFKTQLKAILRAAFYGDVRILFPMIATLEELLMAKAMLEEVRRELDQEGKDYGRSAKVGVMIEVPSLALMADVIAAEVDFFSIGTNDLIQYMMAVDRTNRDVAHLYNPLHPSVLRMLKQVSAAAARGGVELYICGEMAGDAFNLPILLGLGLVELSMNPQTIPIVKNAIRALNAAHAEAFIEEALKLTNAEAVAQLIHKEYGGLIAEIKERQPIRTVA